MRLGYERILMDTVTLEESEDPMVTLRVKGYDDISFKASDGPKVMYAQMSPELREIIDAVYQAYRAAINNRF